MVTLKSRLIPFAVGAALAVGTSGCLKKILLDGQISSTRTASAAVNSFSDWDAALRAASAGLAQFEGLHYLAPDNEDALFLLSRGWAGFGYGFIEDEMEQAQDQYGEESEMAAYHKQRAIGAYSRSIWYGLQILEARNPGFEEAKRNTPTMKEWLLAFDGPEDAEYLFWVGQAWMGRVNLLQGEDEGPAAAADLFVGVLMMERSVELDETYSYGSGHAVLGAYHSRSAMASEELVDAKKHFDRALELTEGKALLVKVNLATRYYCTKVDKEAYVKTLKEVLDAGDTLPEQRLQNTIAKRRARRYLVPWRMEQCGF
jgi:TRAP transporter TatT component family protein